MKDGGPAFPCLWPETMAHTHGMTLRRWYAGMALQGICANPDISAAAGKQGLGGKNLRPAFVEGAFGLADAMIEFEEKEKK